MTNERDELLRLILGRTVTAAVERVLAAGYRKQPTADGKNIAEVLELHQPRTGVRDMRLHCRCGWKGVSPRAGYGELHIRYGQAAEEFRRHQAEALAAAGFGRGEEKVTEVVVDSSKVFMVMCQDPEAHARSYNEGYEAAVTQGLADDPTLAGDWLDGKLAEAFAYGWREGRGAPTPVDSNTGELLHGEALQPDFNPYRGKEDS